MSDLSVQAVRHNRETAKRLKQVITSDSTSLELVATLPGVKYLARFSTRSSIFAPTVVVVKSACRNISPRTPAP